MTALRGGSRGEAMGAGMAQLRQAGVATHRCGGDQALHQRLHGVGAEQPGLLAPAGMEHAIGEDVPALGMGHELDLVHPQEVDLEIDGHRLHRAHPESRPRGDALLLAGDEGRRALAHSGGDAVVDLAREKTQRQADHARFVFEHALDGAMGLSGVGGPQQRADATAVIPQHARTIVIARIRQLMRAPCS